MFKYYVKFVNPFGNESDSQYYFYSKEDLSLKVGQCYFISTSKNPRGYSRPIKIYSKYRSKYNSNYITSAIRFDKMCVPATPAKKIEDTNKSKYPKMVDCFFSLKNGTTTVRWSDNTETTVTCSEEFDCEKGVAMCYMKKFCGNRSSFNEVLKSVIEF